MPRKFSKTNLAIWVDPDFRALPWPAQNLYRLLWDHPKLSYCGTLDWRPRKLLDRGQGWDLETLLAIVDCLRARHFIVVDEEIEECLVRSWVRWDGVMSSPQLAVSMATAVAGVDSDLIRGVLVHELTKLHDREPELAGWKKSQATDLLALPAVDPRSIELPSDPFEDGFQFVIATPTRTIPADVFGGAIGGGFGGVFAPNVGGGGRGSLSTPPTTATATATFQHQPADSSHRPAEQPSSTDVDSDDRFEEFWDTYDKKVGKKAAVRRYRLALKKPGVTADLLIAAAAEYVAWVKADGKHPGYTKDPATWLNGEHWTDERAGRPAGSVPESGIRTHLTWAETAELGDPPDFDEDPSGHRAWYDRRKQMLSGPAPTGDR